MYGCESWTLKKPEHRRIDAFELWCWRRLLRVPWTARKSNQSILKEIGPGCSLEGMILKLKLQYFGHLMWRVNSLEKTLCWEGLGAGGEGDDRGWDGWMASPTRWMWVRVNSDREARCAAIHGVAKTQTWLSDWTELNWTELIGLPPLREKWKEDVEVRENVIQQSPQPTLQRALQLRWISIISLSIYLFIIWDCLIQQCKTDKINLKFLWQAVRKRR